MWGQFELCDVQLGEEYVRANREQNVFKRNAAAMINDSTVITL